MHYELKEKKVHVVFFLLIFILNDPVVRFLSHDIVWWNFRIGSLQHFRGIPVPDSHFFLAFPRSTIGSVSSDVLQLRITVAMKDLSVNEYTMETVQFSLEAQYR